MANLPEVRDEKTLAIISYLTIIGTIVAFVLNKKDNNSFVNFHVKQMIGLNLIYFINQILIYKIFGFIAFSMIFLVIVFLWFIGFMGVINGEKRPIPVIGEHFQEWFKNI